MQHTGNAATARRDDSPFLNLVRDPAGLLAALEARLRTSPALHAAIEFQTCGWSLAKRATLAACVSLIEVVPAIQLAPLEAAVPCDADWRTEPTFMALDLRMRYSHLLFVLLEDRADRDAVDAVFCRIHRLVRARANTKPPRFR